MALLGLRNRDVHKVPRDGRLHTWPDHPSGQIAEASMVKGKQTDSSVPSDLRHH